MERVVYAEENILNYLKTLTSTNSSAVGIILGQSTKARDYVVHMARTEKGEDGGSVEALTFNNVKDIKHLLIKAHVNLAKERLPGGLNVLGIFICSATDIFDTPSLDQTLRKLLASSTKGKSEELFPFPHDKFEELLFHYNPVNQKYMCKTLNVESPSTNFKPVNWKFQKYCTKWCQISSNFGLNFPPIVNKKPQLLKIAVMNFLSDVDKILRNSVVVLGDKVLNESHTLESIIKTTGKKKIINGNEIQLLDASIYVVLPQDPVTPADSRSSVDTYGSKIKINGIIRSQAYISQDGTIDEAIRAVKQDISRSLAARIRFHLDSLVEEPEEESYEHDETIHEPPRRVSVSLPNSPLCFTDYVFPEEDCNEVIRLYKLLLDTEVTEKDVNEDYEMRADISTFHDSTSKKLASTHSDDMLRSTVPKGFLIAAISFAMILIAIAVALRMQRSSSPDGKSR